MLLRDLGEGGFLKRIRERFAESNALLGIGDDAAILDFPAGHAIVYCSDLLAENTHFIRGLHPADSIGYKAVAVNVSDVGAMGGVPMHFVVSLALPPDLELDWADSFYDGIARASRDFGVSLVGGDSSTAERIFVDVAMVGRVRTGKVIRRSGAQAGDSIYVTGALGGSMAGLQDVRGRKLSTAGAQRHLYPQPRHRVALEVADRTHAMIDISDGLSTDLAHIVEESGVCARIYKDKIPCAEGVADAQALHGGEEYELIIVGTDLPESVQGVAVTRIGEILPAGMENRVFLIDGTRESVLQPQGWQHF
jgi:thiamine-monophosphate kinase